ncbi:MAG: hypothetical protein RR512_07100 [Coprobacillus sp.]
MATKKVKKDKLEGLSDRQKNIIRLREKLNQPDPNAIHVFTRYKVMTYVFNILFPPYSLYRIWCKKSPFNTNERIIQTGVCVVYMAVLITIITSGGII